MLAAAGRACPPNAEDLIVKYDQSQLLRLPRPAAEIIIGNPAIADISVQAGNLLVVTGKTFGITNMIVPRRRAATSSRTSASWCKRDEAKVVNLQRGTQRQSYNCTPQCNPSITIGDEQSLLRHASRRPPRRRSASPSERPNASRQSSSQ